MTRFSIFLIFCLCPFGNEAFSQQQVRPEIIVGKFSGNLTLDGVLDEADWEAAPITDNFQTVVPVEGGEPSGRTEVRVIANSRFLVIGVQCFDDQPDEIVRFAKLRDVELDEEDHVRIVIDPFLDGQSGVIFAVNAYGARYDALVSNRGESENKDWDAIWEARSQIDAMGWSAEIRIPIQSISFKKGLTHWGFNVERRIQRYQETIRWTNISRDQWFIQTGRAGLLVNLPAFDYGLGMNIRPSLITELSKEQGENSGFSVDPSLDASQRIGPNILATVTVNTDFAETGVDTRQTNLSRFPVFFPEKRSFFLEGSDIFEFGYGLRREIIPFFSRRIGLYDGNEVPILAGGKLNGRIGKTSFGGLAMRTREADGLPATTMGVIRGKQNILKESSVGFISTFGDPEGLPGAWTSGLDFTYQSTRFRGDKNFLVGVSGMYANRDNLSGDQSALAVKVDYPNDIWDLGLTYMRIGSDFDPALGFAPRNGVHTLRGGGTYGPRPDWNWLRQMRNQVFIFYAADLNWQWESWRLFTAPINWRLESGDRVEVNYMPRGERIPEAFEISEGVFIPEGEYIFHRYRFEAELAAKRKLNGQLTWWFGSFYEGTLDQLEASVNWNPASILTMEFVGTHNIGRLPFGDFDQTLVGLRIRLNASPDLQLNSFIQFDTDTGEMGINARIHWIFHPQGDLFLVYNHNTFDGLERWQLLSQQLLLKARYNIRL